MFLSLPCHSRFVPGWLTPFPSRFPLRTSNQQHPSPNLVRSHTRTTQWIHSRLPCRSVRRVSSASLCLSSPKGFRNGWEGTHRTTPLDSSRGHAWGRERTSILLYSPRGRSILLDSSHVKGHSGGNMTHTARDAQTACAASDSGYPPRRRWNLEAAGGSELNKPRENQSRRGDDGKSATNRSLTTIVLELRLAVGTWRPEEAKGKRNQRQVSHSSK